MITEIIISMDSWVSNFNYIKTAASRVYPITDRLCEAGVGGEMQRMPAVRGVPQFVRAASMRRICTGLSSCRVSLSTWRCVYCAPRLMHPIDMKRLATHSHTIIYDPRKRAITSQCRQRWLNCVEMKLILPNGTHITVSIFSTGTCKFVGSVDDAGVQWAVRRVRQLLRAALHMPELQLKEDSLVCVNTKAEFNLGVRVALSEIHTTFPAISEYNPEVYNGLCMQLRSRGGELSKVNLFSTGKGFVCTKSGEECRRALATLMAMLLDSHLLSAAVRE